MLDALVRVTEKLIELLKYRSEVREKRFRNQIEPLFESLREVHQDYLDLFTACRKELEGEAKLGSIVEHILKRRLEHEPLRRSVIQMAYVFAKKDVPTALMQLFQEVEVYFFRSMPKAPSTPGSDLVTSMYSLAVEERRSEFMLRDFDRWGARETLIAMVDRTLNDIRESWDRLALLYAEAVTGLTQERVRSKKSSASYACEVGEPCGRADENRKRRGSRRSPS